MLAKNDLNNVHFTSLVQKRKCAVTYWLVHKIYVFDEQHQKMSSWSNLLSRLNILCGTQNQYYHKLTLQKHCCRICKICIINEAQ